MELASQIVIRLVTGYIRFGSSAVFIIHFYLEDGGSKLLRNRGFTYYST